MGWTDEWTSMNMWISVIKKPSKGVLWKISIKALWIIYGSNKSQTLICKENVLHNMETTDFSTDCTSEEYLPERRMRAKYIAKPGGQPPVKFTADCTSIPVQLPMHIQVHLWLAASTFVSVCILFSAQVSIASSHTCCFHYKLSIENFLIRWCPQHSIIWVI